MERKKNASNDDHIYCSILKVTHVALTLITKVNLHFLRFSMQ